jgi:hypothetical protein
MKVTGPKDTTYASLFSKEDIPSLLTMAEEVRATHNTSLVEEFNKKCQQKYDDHNPVLVLGNKNIEFLSVSKSDDLVVTAGTNQIIDQILGASTTRFRYMVVGSSTTAVTLADTTVPGTTVYTDMTGRGWLEYASTTLFFAGIAGVTVASFTINTAGVMTGPASGTLLNRNMFSNFPLVHTVNVTGYLISSIIEFCPKM